MTLHLIRLSVGSKDLRHAAERQKQWHTTYHGQTVMPVYTRRAPRRDEELLKGGSLYWVIKNNIRARQTILGIEEIKEEGEEPYCLIMLDAKIMRVQPIGKKAFQGWRYLQPSDAPPDIGFYDSDDDEEIDPQMEKELIELGLL